MGKTKTKFTNASAAHHEAIKEVEQLVRTLEYKEVMQWTG